MSHALTRHDLKTLEDTLTIGGDLVLLPQLTMPMLSDGFSLDDDPMPTMDAAIHAKNTRLISREEALHKYLYENRNGGTEPAWVTALPIEDRKYVRRRYAEHNEDPYAIIGTVPYTGITVMVKEDGLCEEAAQLFWLERLRSIRQLGYLNPPWLDKRFLYMSDMMRTHSRYVHSLDVMSIATVLAYRLGFSGSFLNVGRVAALTHDFGTPAGGDSVKLIDPAEFDEDVNYPRLVRERIGHSEWDRFCTKYGIEEQLLFKTILNKGPLGQVLDIADKLAYIARDMVGFQSVVLNPESEDLFVGLRAIKELNEAYPDICSIWDSVDLVGEDVAFTEPERLVAFLKARVVMFRELYYHPRARFSEYLVSRILVKRLYDRGEITRDELLSYGDNWLEGRLHSAYGKRRITEMMSLHTNVRSFRSMEEARAFSKTFEQKGHRFLLIENNMHGIKPGLHFKVKTKRGALPLSEALPGEAEELMRMATLRPGVQVYYLDDDFEIEDTGMLDLFQEHQPTLL